MFVSGRPLELVFGNIAKINVRKTILTDQNALTILLVKRIFLISPTTVSFVGNYKYDNFIAKFENALIIHINTSKFKSRFVVHF